MRVPDNILATDRKVPDNVLPTDGALCHLFAALSAGAHVTALQHHTVNLFMDVESGFRIESRGERWATGESMQILHMESSSIVSPSSLCLCS